ncbi:hypothetical protein [Bifidobacterium sp. 2450]|nr:hypothetical protein [Bifidobacterium longum]
MATGIAVPAGSDGGTGTPLIASVGCTSPGWAGPDTGDCTIVG